MPRFYCPAVLSSGLELELPPGAARHVQVLRLQPGDAITLFNNGPDWDGPYTSGSFEARITRMGRSDVQVQVGEHHSGERDVARQVHLAVGMPANDRMDWLVEKAVELGVGSIQPLMSERSVLRLTGERAAKKVAHWQSVAIAASEQCGGNRVPAVHAVTTLVQWLPQWRNQLPEQTTPLLLSLRTESRPCAEFRSSTAPALFLSGPEGGFSAAEEQAAVDAGFVAVGLGPRTLRAETAALAAMAALTLSL